MEREREMRRRTRIYRSPAMVFRTLICFPSATPSTQQSYEAGVTPIAQMSSSRLRKVKWHMQCLRARP